MGQYSKALAVTEEAEQLAQILDDPLALLKAKISISNIYDTMGRYIDATELYEAALVFSRGPKRG